MPIYETFTKRMKRLSGKGQPDVYKYDSLPDTFRRQVIHIWSTAIGLYISIDSFGIEPPAVSTIFWHEIFNKLCREKGVFSLGDGSSNPCIQCKQYIQKTDTNGVLDIIELSFNVINNEIRKKHPYERNQCGISQDPDDAISELNARFQEHGIGYEFVQGKLVKRDSQFIHSEVVKQALSLMHDNAFSGANDEFLRAHEHYRKGRYKEAIGETLKSFESTMKTVCDLHRWKYLPTDTAKPLIDKIIANGLIPSYLSSHFDGLRSSMESGLPTIRNKTSGHGQGAIPIEIPAHFAAYAIHLAASNIVLLIEAHKAFKKP